MRQLDPTSPPPDPDILFEDAHIWVVVKPTLLLSVPGRGPDKADCVVARLTRKDLKDEGQTDENLADEGQADEGQTDEGQAPRVIHRLDMETSGLLVLAKTAEAQSHISKQFATRTVHKTYEAVVEGIVAPEDPSPAPFTIDLPLITDWPNRPKQMVDHDRGKPAQTVVTIMDRTRQTTRVRLEPLTGRSHQLRVHLLSIGHAILGDSLYATDAGFAAAPRLLLHATSLGFTHPATEELLTFHSPAPF